MIRGLIATVLALVSAAALGQVQQSGTVTGGHPTAWQASGAVRDAGPATNGNLTGLGILSNAQKSNCINTAAITGPYDELCLGVVAGAAGYLSLQNYNGATAIPLQFIINGTTYQFPSSSASVFVGTAISSGSANAQVISAVSNIAQAYTLANGVALFWQAGYTNTGPLTLQVASTAASNVFIQTATGPQNLNGGEVQLGQWYSVVYDGSEYQLLNPTLAASTCAQVTGNLIGTIGGVNVQTGNYTVAGTDACGVVYETSATGATITLPKPSTTTGFPTGFVNYFSTTITNASYGTVTISSSASIYAPNTTTSTSYSLYFGYSASVYTDGTSWYIIPLPNFNKQFFVGGTGPNSQAQNTTEYYPINQITAGTTSQTPAGALFPPGQFVGFTFQGTAPGAGDTITITLVQNGTPTSSTCTISGASTNTCSSTTAFSSSASQTVIMKVVTSTTLVSTGPYQWYVQFNPR